MTRVTVTLAGSGLAELTCARLLAERGHRIRLPAREPAGPRPLLLNAPTLELFRSLWPEDPAALLPGAVRLTGRLVGWGAGTAPRRLAQPALLVDGTALAARLAALLADRCSGAGPHDWLVTAAPGGQPAAGRRRLLAGEALLARGVDERTARLECTTLGWLQLTPLGDGRALLQAMVPGPVERPAALLARLLAGSRLAPLLRRAPNSAAAVEAAPRLHPAPATAPAAAAAGPAPGRLVVGAGAIRYDPLSGTGTAQALRTAILAAAVIDSAARGTPPGPLCTHYTARLAAAFREHLDRCAALYGEAFPWPAWQDEIDAARVAGSGTG
ncbi:hypothetical protein [Kitasatospora sp. NPDC057223]|uniref:hypothetical protein n=1 Tax=Kitasatospora sp. NPDC057223 TaxID=3346055 RepID=UPI0036251D3D